MTRVEIAKRLAKRLSISQKEALIITKHFFSSLVDESLSSERVELRGFGTFKAVRRASRPARDFKTGRAIQAPERLRLTFKAGKNLKERVNPVSIRLPMTMKAALGK